MSFHKMKPFWITGAFFGLLFILLFSIRSDIFHEFFSAPPLSNSVSDSPLKGKQKGHERDSWMNIFQNDLKIGYSHSSLSKQKDGYRLQETVFMRINTLGMTQDMNLSTKAVLNPDFTLSSLDFKMDSGLFSFVLNGTVSGDVLSLSITSSGAERTMDMKLEKKPYITAGIMDAVRAAQGKPGDAFFFDIFDPSTMSQETVTVNIIAKGEILNMGIRKKATQVTLSFKGATQQAWIGENGEVLKEKGLLGITLVKTDKNDAIFGAISDAGEDLTKVASIESNRIFDNPSDLDILKIRISGITYDNFLLDGGRQTFKGDVLTIQKEDLSAIQRMGDFEIPETFSESLKATTFIQSDHEKIRNLAGKIVLPDDKPLKKAEKLMNWIYENIEKRPVLSLPDAMSTLENRMGDCNEHAVLFAAMARASGIPSEIETGLVYLDGRFYYHAWNSLYLGQWVSADAVFAQMPADVTHIRLASGGQDKQLDLLGIIGKVKLEVMEH